MIRYCAFCARKLPNRRELPPVFCSVECRTNGQWAAIQAKDLEAEWSRRPSAFPPASLEHRGDYAGQIPE